MDGNDSIRNFCRICASNPPDVRNIFEVVYKEKLLSDILSHCLQCTIYRTEYLPEHICSQCCTDLIKMHKFIEKYEKSEKWFMSRYNAMNEAPIIKTETISEIEFKQDPDISVEPIQSPPSNPLDLIEKFDDDYGLEMAEMPSSPIGSQFQIQKLNEADCHEQGINENKVQKAIQKRGRARTENKTEQFECKICSKQFFDPHNLKQHENLHTGGKNFDCYFCDAKLFRSDYRAKHIRKMHPENRFECFDCKDNFDQHYELGQHMQRGCHETSSGNKSNTNKRYICEICGNGFSKKWDLSEHKVVHSDERNFKCSHQDCEKSFKRKEHLQDHLKFHEGKKHFCECGKGFVLARQLRRHRVTHLQDQQPIVATYQCSLCPKFYKMKEGLKRHMDRHSGKFYPCKYCDLQFTSHSGRNKHERNIHEAPKSYECFDCKRVFKLHSDLCRHMEVHSSNGRITFECKYCFKPFWWEHTFIRHKRKHTEKIHDCEYCDESFVKRFDLHCHVEDMHYNKLEQYKCDQCSNCFPLKATLKAHIYRVHISEKRQESHLCMECGLTFPSSSRLQYHLKIHSDEKPFACSQCPNKYKHEGQLRTHMRLHSSERNFVCKDVVHGGRICGKAFQTFSILKTHRKTHRDDRPFQCQSCPAKFANNYRLQVHTRIHTGERPFVCEHCERAFTQKGDMTKHMLIHLGPTPHKCTECDASFRLETELRKHSLSHYKPAEN